MDLSAINEVAKIADFLPTRKLKDLEVQLDHPITRMKFVQTAYGKRIVIEVGNEFATFLPARLVTALDSDKEMFEKMVKAAQAGKLYMNYYGGRYNSVEFKSL